MSESTVSHSPLSYGIDLGAIRSRVCAVRGTKIEREFNVPGTPEAFRKEFENLERGIVLMEVCGTSPWASKVLEELGFEVLICQATTLKATVSPKRKNDRDDARALAKLCSEHRGLLRLVKHRSESLQTVVRQLRIRRNHIKWRASAILAVRGFARSAGVTIEPGSVEAFAKRARKALRHEFAQELTELLETIERMNQAIARIEEVLEKMAEKYPATNVLRQVTGVGAITAMAFVVTIQDPTRFSNGRAVGNYLGLTPKQYQSGERDPQLRISKAGDSYMRTLLVQCAQYILSHEKADSDLRRAGLKIAEHGGPRGKKRAVIAVARKLAVLLLSLWKTGEVYDPLRHTRRREAEQAACVVT